MKHINKTENYLCYKLLRVVKDKNKAYEIFNIVHNTCEFGRELELQKEYRKIEKEVKEQCDKIRETI